MTTRTIFLLVALCNLAAAGEQPAKLSEPFILAAPAAHKPQYFPRVAWSVGAKAWLVVWQDGAPTDDGTNGEGPAQNVLAVRVSADGKVLDAKPIEVSTAKGAQMRPRVASDGKGWLVVWHDLRNGKDWDLYAARVTNEGKALDEGGALLAGGEHNQCFPDVVFGGGNYYVAWLDMRHWPEYRVFGSRVSRDAKALDGRGAELLRMMNDKEMDAWRKAPFAPGKKGIGWHDFGVKGTSGMKQPGPPSLVTNGKVHVVTSNLQVAGASREYAVRVVDAGTGKPSATQSGFASLSKMDNTHLSNYWVRAPSVAVKDKSFLTAGFVYTVGFGAGGGGVWTASFLGPDGKPAGASRAVFLDAEQRIPPGYRTYGLRHLMVDLAWDGKRALFVAEHHRHGAGKRKATPTHSPGNIDVLALFVNHEGKRLADPASEKTVEPDAVKTKGSTLILPEGCKVAPIGIATGPATQSAPAVAAGPEGSFLVLWQEEEPGKDSRIMARLVRVK